MGIKNSSRHLSGTIEGIKQARRRIGLKEAAILICIIFCTALIYMFEYSTALNLTFEADKKTRTLDQKSTKIEQMRVKTLKLSSYQKITEMATTAGKSQLEGGQNLAPPSTATAGSTTSGQLALQTNEKSVKPATVGKH